jgi:hypothetical protein
MSRDFLVKSITAAPSSILQPWEAKMSVSKNAIIGVTRREFIAMTAMATAGVAVGCATNPVTGRSQLMLMDEQE